MAIKQLLLLVASAYLSGCSDTHDSGSPQSADPVMAQQLVADKRLRQQRAEKALGLSADPQRQILFGDLHVHTTLSPDAFITAMPLMSGDGLHPPADACDFARFCSVLDFWSINDHAEGITPERWQQTREAIRQCNAVASDDTAPDTVAFLGWEWSQVSHYDKNKHYGHKNVLFIDTDDDKVPARSIAAPRDQLGSAPIGRLVQLTMAAMDFGNRDYYLSINDYYQAIAETPVCDKGVDTRDLPADCLETADDPQELFSKLNQWGFDHLVIPHGNSWGINTPPGTTFDKQLTQAQSDPSQSLFEIYSGHGSAEEYRDWRAVAFDQQGKAYCPVSSEDYQPCCRRAGEIIRERCAATGATAQECQQREQVAQQNFIDAGVSGHLTVPGATTLEWLNCGTCTDCFNPPQDHRPATSAQYALAISNFDQPEPRRFEFGFIGSSDNHRARGGSGYKEFARHAMTEATGAKTERAARSGFGDNREPVAYSMTLAEAGDVGLGQKRNMERQSSFFMTGGLVAVHSDNRGREAIWKSLKQRQVYGTSGDRILLWFDLVEDERSHPMGSSVNSVSKPRFVVKAAGAFEQQPGCPAATTGALSPDRIESLCRGECYNPGDQRKLIDRIEIVRIQPQQSPDEAVGDLIEDPWRVFECPPDSNGCQVEFEDEDFVGDQRETRYYVRAIQQASDAVNAGGLRCEYDEQGQCIAVNPCYGDFRTDASDDCLAPNQERAWSSPIYLKYQRNEPELTATQ